MLEEAEAEILPFHLISAWHCFPLAEKPYRPHPPFPEHYHLIRTGQVRIVHGPLNSKDAGQIAKVEATDLQTTVSTFLSCGYLDLPELYELVNELERQ